MATVTIRREGSCCRLGIRVIESFRSVGSNARHGKHSSNKQDGTLQESEPKTFIAAPKVALHRRQHLSLGEAPER